MQRLSGTVKSSILSKLQPQLWHLQHTLMTMGETFCLHDVCKFSEIHSRFARRRFLSCDVDLSIVMSELIRDEVVIILDSYNEQNSIIELKNATFGMQQRLHADHSFGLSKQRISAWYWRKVKKWCSGMGKCYYDFISKLERMRRCSVSLHS